jgi:hypothetical protein
MSRATENPTSKVHPSEATRPLSDLGQDLHFALRTLRSAPGFAIAAILTLAIGIGANTAIFSAVDGVLLKPLPYSRAEQIVRIYQNDRAKNKPRDDVAPGNFAQWRARATSFAAMAAVEPYGLIYSGPEGEEQIRNWNVTEDFFRVLDARPRAGRLFLPEDYRPGAPAVLVLTYESWQKRFGGESGLSAARSRSATRRRPSSAYYRATSPISAREHRRRCTRRKCSIRSNAICEVPRGTTSSLGFVQTRRSARHRRISSVCRRSSRGSIRERTRRSAFRW